MNWTDLLANNKYQIGIAQFRRFFKVSHHNFRFYMTKGAHFLLAMDPPSN